jgi:hypothetical protein
MIHKTIKKDIHDEFQKLKTELRVHVEPGFDINRKKAYLKNHIPEKIASKSEQLLNTLLNYLMAQARKDLERADIELQNKFLETDFRKRIKQWTSQLENELKINPNIVNYSTDPRLKQGLIAGGITFVVGSIVTKTVFIPTIVVGAIVSGLVTILLSAIAFKIAYDKAAPKSRDAVRADIDKSLEIAKLQVQTWLKSVIDAFSKDFSEFCSSNGFRLEDK